MPVSAVYLGHRRPVDYGVTPGSTTITRRGRELFRRFLNVANGAVQGASADGEYTLVQSSTTEPAFAVGALTLSGASGAVGGIINGVTLTATHGTTDILDAALIAGRRGLAEAAVGPEIVADLEEGPSVARHPPRPLRRAPPRGARTAEPRGPRGP